MRITIKQLKILMEVAQRGSMMHAAAALHISPPAVSMQIKELEEQIGLPLFDRNKNQVTLSTAGKHFIVHARRVLANLQEAENSMAQLKGLDHGSLAIGIVTTAAYFVPRLLARFHSEHPGIDVKLRVVYNHDQSVALLDAGEVDLIVLARPLQELDAVAHPFADYPLVFVGPPQHPLMNHARLSMQALAESVFILREQGVRPRTVFESFLAAHRCTPQVTMELPSNELIKQAVMAGMGLGFLPLQTIDLELRHGLLGVLDVRDTPVTEAWDIVHLHSRVLSPAAEAFRDFIIDQGKEDLRAHNAELLSLAFKKRTSTRR